MIYFKKFFSFCLILLLLSSCGFSDRMYLTSDKRIAVTPRGYSVKAYKRLDEHQQQKIKRRNRTLVVTMIVSANALIFFPLFLNQHTDAVDK